MDVFFGNKNGDAKDFNMVPYRALAGFFHKSDETVDWGSVRRLTAYIEKIKRDTVLLPYTLGKESKLKKKVYFQDLQKISLLCIN